MYLLKNRFKYFSSVLTCIIYLNTNTLYAQKVELIPEPGFIDYSIYYLNSIDFKNASIKSRIFSFRLHSENYENPVYAKVWTQVTFRNPNIGIHGNLTLIELETEPFELKAELILDSRDMALNTNQLIDVEGNTIPINYSAIDDIKGDLLNNISNEYRSEYQFQNTLTTGRLIDGVYTFKVEVFSGSSPNDLNLTDSEIYSANVESPSYVNLESPGGILSDTVLTEIYSTFPFFSWYPSSSCTNCESEIRISKFDKNKHSSVEDAINENVMIPQNNKDWEELGFVNSYQYPISKVENLKHNSIYVWQVRTKLSSTLGDEYIYSPIWAFKIGQYADSYSDYKQKHPLLDVLFDAITEENFSAYFGPEKKLEKYIPTGNFLVDGELKDETDIIFYLNQIINKKETISNISVSNEK